MKTTHRDYSEELGDFNRLCRFVTADSAATRKYTAWCIGRIVDWKYAIYDKKQSYIAFCAENAHLWFDGFGELAGFVVNEGGDSDFGILTQPGYRFLYEEILQWAVQNWSSRGPCLSTEITEHQELEAKALERNGFRCAAPFFCRRFDLTGEIVPRVELEPGFTMIDMASHPDYRAQVIMRADAFQGISALSESELEKRLTCYNHSIHGPIYHANTDVAVMAPDGRIVAGCEALIDARNAEADIERVCTHSAFRRRGFARAAIVECFHRLREMGIHTAYITGYGPGAIALYGSLGHVAETKLFVYEKRVDQAG